MFPVRELVFTVFVGLGFFFCGPQHANGECNGLTTYLKSSQNGSFYVSMDRYGYVNRSCTWLITAPTDQRVLIYFTSFRLLNCYRCVCDSVTITDGKYTWSPRLAKYCGRDLPRPVYSSGRQILITFQPSFDVYEYFTLHYSTLSYPSSGCPSIVPGASAGVIYSPNFPWNYAESKSCDWYIEVPYQQYININFTYINTYECEGYVKIYDEYGDLKRSVWLCYSPIPSSVTYSESVRVRYYPYSSSSSFLAFYQIGYNVPFPVTTYAPPTTRHSHSFNPACQPYSNSIIIHGSGSTFISTRPVPIRYMSTAPDTTCRWHIATTEGYTLEMKFDDMSISGCQNCSCGYVTVRDGSGSSAPSIGSFCSENFPSIVSSTGNHMFIRFYAGSIWDSFNASVNSKETEAHRLRIPGIVVPSVIGVVLFAVIITVVKCIRIRRFTGEEGSSQLPLLLEPTPPDDEEMIDLTEDNNTASGISETA